MPRPPSDFHGFVGQRRVVARLRQQLAGARAHGEPCPPVLLIGPSGVGKTELAKAVAHELGSTLFVAHGQDAARDLAAKLLQAQAGDILFIDEAHNAKAKVQEMLYQVIDEARLPGWACQPPTAGAAATQAAQRGVGQDNPVEVQRVTLILATDQPGRLLNALYKRMELVEALEPYPRREMQAIVDRVATDAGVLLSGQARNAIARVSGGLPRLARHYLRGLRRHYADAGPQTIGQPEVRRFLKAFDVDARGLRREHRQVLRHLGKVGKASVESLARRLGADADHVQRQVEPQLVQLDLIRIYPGGRALTEAGRAWLTEHAKGEPRPKRPRPSSQG